LITLSSELLPAPLGPISAQISPAATSKLTSVTAFTPLNNSEMRSSASSGGAVRHVSGTRSGRDRLQPAFEFAHQRQHLLAEVPTSSMKCRKPVSTRSTPIAFSATIRSAICCGVPIRLVRKPSLYCTRSSNVDFAQLPSLPATPARLLHRVAERIDRLDVRMR
jgi:hypothetical protein